jgi:hypothetical protein
MSILNNSLLLGADAGAAGYQISRSLRFNSSDSAKCARTYSSGSSTTTQTFALWIKRAKLGATGCFWSGYDGSAAYGAYFQFDSGDTLTVILGGASLYQLTTTQVFRDASAWYHIVLNIDTNNATSSDRIRLYVNGSRVTTFSTASYPTSGYACQFAMGNANNTIGTTWGSSAYSFFDGYLADIHFIDGQALTPASFAETNATTGQWVPKAYTGSYGTNGFKLSFSNNASTTTISQDSSGNNNHWTANNISVTAGAGNDSLVDTPTSYGVDTGAGGEVRGNYATLNPLQASSSTTLSNGNLDISSSAAGGQTLATLGVSSGKWYFEGTLITYSGTQPDPFIGISNTSNPSISAGASSNPGYAANSYAVYLLSGNTYIQKVNNNTFTNTGTTQVSNGDVVGVAFDLDNGKFWVSKNGTWIDSGNPVTGANALFSGLTGSFAPTFRGSGSSTGTAAWACNFGQRPFAYTAPSGFKALCDTNLPAPTIARPSAVMDVKLYTGNGSTQTISGLGFSPDFVWIKKRNSGSNSNHLLADTVRGVSTFLSSSGTFAESTFDATWRSNWGDLTAFNSDGFTVVAGSSSDDNINDSPNTHVAWTWDAGSSTVTNTSGSISSQVRANASAGFSIVTYTGNGTSGATIGHGLGVVPAMLIFKSRSRSTNDWKVWISSFANTEALLLNSTTAKLTGQSSFLNSTTPTSSVITLGTDSDVNFNAATYVAYCFAPVAGYSAFGSYTGNGSSDGPFVFTGFRPALVLVRRTDSSGDWRIWDMRRDRYNVTFGTLAPNTSAAENTAEGSEITGIDFLSNGFKLRSTGTNHNASGGTFIYAAFAESPFQYARAR